jgi:hypothetical protein
MATQSERTSGAALLNREAERIVLDGVIAAIEHGWPESPNATWWSPPTGGSAWRRADARCSARPTRPRASIARRSSASAARPCGPSLRGLTSSTASDSDVKRRLADAQAQLRTAYELCAGIGMEAFADRARAELEATGEKVRKRSDATSGNLTPARAAGSGVGAKRVVELRDRLQALPQPTDRGVAPPPRLYEARDHITPSFGQSAQRARGRSNTGCDHWRAELVRIATEIAPTVAARLGGGPV